MEKALSATAFPGNIRELENILERASTLAEADEITADDLFLNEQATNATSEIVDSVIDQGAGDLGTQLDDVEKKAILDVLEETRWNRTAAAEKLGMSLRALRYRLQKYGLNK